MDDSADRPDPKSQRELKVSKIILVVLAVISLLFVVWAAWFRPAREGSEINSFDECAAAGNPVQESYPEVCTTPAGARFTRPIP